ncbi:MAG: phosphoadenosine phosphosulfate reductase family protein, partial [Archaeoglobi archaeon]|nr:phosphoadenosine phosphosulfate reductase family protein [Candidatus Mnemosynella bozhongmuii]
LISPHCDLCGNEGKKVQISPPGDVRIALSGDLKLLRETLRENFGDEELISKKVVLLNGVSYEDRMDEVIIDGEVVGNFRFNGSFEFLPRIPGATWMRASKGIVEVDEGALEPILRGANVMARGVLSAKGVRRNQEVIVKCSGRVIATGRALKDEDDLESGVFVKTRHKGIFGRKRPERDPSLKDVIRANLTRLEELEREAIEFIRRVSRKFSLPVTVSYSGGKDSLVTLALVDQALEDYSILFVDTGLEFPETVEHVRRISELFEKPLLSASSDLFWKALEKLGPPSVNRRWCCKLCKLAPLSKLIKENFSSSLSFIGQRKYESRVRYLSGRVWKNFWMGNQISASPVQNWNALEIWLYIFWKNLPYNPLYDLGYERIGCWMCPASDLADFELLRRTHPELHEKWFSWLRKYAERAGKNERWVSEGLWRYEGNERKERKSGCFDRILEERIHSSPPEQILEALRPLGEVSRSSSHLVLKRGNSRALIFPESGRILVHGENSPELLQLILSAIRRFEECLGCSLCASHCRRDAIKFTPELRITSECSHCGKCLEVCPLIFYSSD